MMKKEGELQNTILLNNIIITTEQSTHLSSNSSNVFLNQTNKYSAILLMYLLCKHLYVSQSSRAA